MISVDKCKICILKSDPSSLISHLSSLISEFNILLEADTTIQYSSDLVQKSFDLQLNEEVCLFISPVSIGLKAFCKTSSASGCQFHVCVDVEVPTLSMIAKSCVTNPNILSINECRIAYRYINVGSTLMKNKNQDLLQVIMIVDTSGLRCQDTAMECLLCGNQTTKCDLIMKLILTKLQTVNFVNG
jgi:hypothetical protein